MNISEKIRAARALLNWKQEELAAASGVSVASIRKIELNETAPTMRTQSKILHALEKHGITFTAKGIEKDDYPVYAVEGDTHEETYLKLLDDADAHLSTIRNPELLIMYANDEVSPPSVVQKYRQMRARGVAMRQLIQEGNEFIMGPLEEYRYIPKELFINRVTLVYGDRIANETADVRRGIIRLDPLNARIQRNVFDILWKILKQPEKSICDERF